MKTVRPENQTHKYSVTLLMLYTMHARLCLIDDHPTDNYNIVICPETNRRKLLKIPLAISHLLLQVLS